MYNMWKTALRLRNGYKSARELIQKDERSFSFLSTCDKTQHINIVTKYNGLNHRNASTNEGVAGSFGSLSGPKLKQVKVDKDELEEEKYYKGRRPRIIMKSDAVQQCLSKVTVHIKNKNLSAAITTLKEYGTQTNTFLYNILLRELSRSGQMEECYRLYKLMKEIGLEPNQATYTNLMNACAESKSTKALERLDSLRQSLYEKQVVLNDTHYNAMIKAYGRHGKTQEAFMLVDEMCEKRLPVGDYTYSSLLQAAISNKKSGLRLALSAWHLMRYSRITPKKHHYDLLLTAMKQTKLGEMKVDDAFLKEKNYAQIQYSETEEPNLLASPPVMSGLLLPLVKGPPRKAQGIHEEIANINEKVSDSMLQVYRNVDSIQEVNNLILFGGFEQILKSMEADGVKPDVTTATILLDMLPPSIQAEHTFLSYIKAKDIALDTCFYNMLMRRRISRKELMQAKDVLNIMQRAKIIPDLATYQILALTCHSLNHAAEFLDSIMSLGYAPNKSVIAVLLKTACHHVDFHYVSFLLHYMQDNSIYPNERMIITLKDFVKLLGEAKAKRYRTILNRKIERKNIPWIMGKINQFLVAMLKKQDKNESQKS